MWHQIWGPKAASPQDACSQPCLLLQSCPEPHLEPALHRSAPAHCFVWYSTAQGIPQHPTLSCSPEHLTAHIIPQPRASHRPQHATASDIPQYHTASHSIPQLSVSHSSQHPPSHSIAYPQPSTSYSIPGLLPMWAGVSPLAPTALGQGLPAASRAPSVPVALP